MRSSIRVLHVITGASLDGSVMDALLPATLLAGRGFQFTVMITRDCPSDGSLARFLDRHRIRVVRSRYLMSRGSLTRDLMAFLELRIRIHEGRYDLVHAHGTRAMIIARLAAKLPRSATVVQTVHRWLFRDHRTPLALKASIALEKLGFRLSNRTILHSERDLGWAVYKGIGKPGDYTVVPSGIDLREFLRWRGNPGPARQKLGIPPDAPTVLGSIVDLRRKSGLDLLLRTARTIRERFPDTFLVLFASGGIDRQARRRVATLGLDDRLVVRPYGEDLPELLPALDVMLQTSSKLGFPRCITEALAAGVPVVTTAACGCTDFVSTGQRGGFIVDTRDSSELASCALRILEDAHLARKLVEGFDEDALEPYSLESSAAAVEKLYRDLIAPGLRVVFLCDSEPFNIPSCVQTIITRLPGSEYTIVPLPGHGSLEKLPLMLRKYADLYGIALFPFRLVRFLWLRLRGLIPMTAGRPSSLRQVAYLTGSRYMPLVDVNNDVARDQLESLQPDLFISLACPQILKRDTLAIPRLGCFNLHSSLLPKNRGMMPAFWSLYNGRGETGVTLHRMIRKLDAGGIVMQKPIRASIRNTSLEELMRECKEVGAELVIDLLERLRQGREPRVRDNSDELATRNRFPSRHDISSFTSRGGRVVGRAGKTRVAMSFDVEEWFQTSAARKWHPEETWDSLPQHAVDTLSTILDLLEAHNARATFFFLGWIVERHPALVGRILEKGHEAASLGYTHQALTSRSREDFSADLDRVQSLMDRLGLPRPIGFRAPSFSVVTETMWAIDDIISHGYLYDSSIYPMFRHRRYGVPDAPTTPFVLETSHGRLLELPIASGRLWGMKIPVGGGVYLRFYPEPLYRALLERTTAMSPSVPVTYCHPWEIDRTTPGAPMTFFQRFRQTYNTGAPTRRKLARILEDYETVSLKDLYEELSSPEEERCLPRVYSASL
ncbi:DUF3473 domain-containing protein [Candidatus Fermentibacterales bacterium]|nr:DUF3473 domain-containing protein [Candidatus Fermentibacterales bacterium]